jgi:uncharacterized protein (TIGR03083 family)
VDDTEARRKLDALVGAYRDALEGLLAATDGLDDEGWATATGCPGWDVHDQLAHCVGLERRLLGDPDRDPDVEVGDLPHLTGDVGRFLERDVASRRGMAHDDLRAEAREAFDRRIAGLEALRPEQLEEDTPSLMGPMRTSAALRMRIFDLACHERDVRAAVDRLEGWGGPHVDTAVEHSLRSWMRTAPARVEGASTLVFVVDGRPPAALDLAAGELRRDEASTTTADATVHLAADQVLALVGGRADAPTADDLEVTGDEGLVRRFVAIAAVTP